MGTNIVASGSNSMIFGANLFDGRQRKCNVWCIRWVPPTVPQAGRRSAMVTTAAGPIGEPHPSLSFGIAISLTPDPDDPNPPPWPAAVSFLVTVVGLKQAALPRRHFRRIANWSGGPMGASRSSSRGGAGRRPTWDRDAGPGPSESVDPGTRDPT